MTLNSSKTHNQTSEGLIMNSSLNPPFANMQTTKSMVVAPGAMNMVVQNQPKKGQIRS